MDVLFVVGAIAAAVIVLVFAFPCVLPDSCYHYSCTPAFSESVFEGATYGDHSTTAFITCPAGGIAERQEVYAFNKLSWEDVGYSVFGYYCEKGDRSKLVKITSSASQTAWIDGRPCR